MLFHSFKKQTIKETNNTIQILPQSIYECCLVQFSLIESAPTGNIGSESLCSHWSCDQQIFRAHTFRPPEYKVVGVPIKAFV